MVQLHAATIPLQEVVVSSYRAERIRQSSLQIETLAAKEISENGSFNLTDALAKLPSVNQFSTGIGISKPSIRGLYGNRILVLFNGLRFDNQQWQDEHGLGLSSMGVGQVEVIKGPLSVLYGTEAQGGIINIIEEAPAAIGSTERDISVQLHSNTGGGLLNYGEKHHTGNRWYGFRLGIENHADYSDGNSDRVLNSRFNGYYAKGSYGFLKDNWHSENHYQFSLNNFGFIFNDLTTFFEADDRWSRAMNGPHHIVGLNLLSSENYFTLKNSSLKVNVCLQSNFRTEDEGGAELSLVMHLIITQHFISWEKPLSQHTTLILANNGSLENNTNYGKRKLIPDAWLAENNASAYLKHQWKAFGVEYGFGGRVKHINALLTPDVNSEEKEIAPFVQNRLFTNGLVGFTYTPSNYWLLKANVSTGVRAPNLSELSSNSLHEGIYVYEVGDPTMVNERNLNTEISVDYTTGFLQVGVAGFYNQFADYIYLLPTDEDWFGFPVARYKQQDATIYGSETYVTFKLPWVQGLSVGVNFSALVGQLQSGDYLPYMPANKLKTQARYEYQSPKKRTAYAFVNSTFVDAQQLVSSSEKETSNYTLLNVGVGCGFPSGKLTYTIGIAANNLLNEVYYDHLSRIKNFGLLNIGRDIALNFKLNF